MMKPIVLFLFLFLLSLGLVVATTNYAGLKVVRAYLENEKQIAQIGSWNIDVWTAGSTLVLGWNDFMVNDVQMLELVKLEVPFDILIHDVEQHLEEGQRDLEESRRNKDAMLADFFIAYHTYDEFAEYLKNITGVYSTIASFNASIGKSIQGRDIFAVAVGSKTPKNKIFVSGGQHAREWIAPATTMYILTQLITSTNAEVKALLADNQFLFVPLVNPDGYIYSWGGSSQRLWRKNRRPNVGGSFGVDLNRNWNDHWGQEGTSTNPTSDTYGGTGPFSEPETTALSKYFNDNNKQKNIAGSMDYHSYSQLILRPYGWTNAAPPNNALLTAIGATIRARILAVNNVPYTSQAVWQLYYASGSAQDWCYSEGSVPVAYTIELRDTGTYGFQLPATQIKPTGAENWAGFLYFAQAAIENFPK